MALLAIREFDMSNDGDVSFTPIPVSFFFFFSPFQKKRDPLSQRSLFSLLLFSVFLHNLCRQEPPLSYNVFFSYILPLYILILPHGGLLVLYFFPLLPFLFGSERGCWYVLFFCIL